MVELQENRLDNVVPTPVDVGVVAVSPGYTVGPLHNQTELLVEINAYVPGNVTDVLKAYSTGVTMTPNSVVAQLQTAGGDPAIVRRDGLGITQNVR